jgi:hypothetical protein
MKHSLRHYLPHLINVQNGAMTFCQLEVSAIELFSELQTKLALTSIKIKTIKSLKYY